ncbi:hypothetical protein T310_6314, partial [Rasamsonia emersonii CBS 393.64]
RSLRRGLGHRRRWGKCRRVGVAHVSQHDRLSCKEMRFRAAQSQPSQDRAISRWQGCDWAGAEMVVTVVMVVAGWQRSLNPACSELSVCGKTDWRRRASLPSI